MTHNFSNFSILIPFKDEEKNLPDLLSSLNHIKYPETNFEIIFIDDNSSDNSINIVKSFCNLKRNVSIIKNNEDNSSGKKAALSKGINKSKFDIIITTDADCFVPSDWLNEYNNSYKDDFDFIAGVSSYKQGNNLLNRFICFEDLRVKILSFHLTPAKNFYNAVGRNLSFKKSKFFDAGGYNLNTLSGDDDLLLKSFIEKGFKIGVLNTTNANVLTKAKTNVKGYLRQRARHTKASFLYSLGTQIFLGSWHILNIICLFSILLTFVNFNFIFPFLLKILLDITLVKKYQNHYLYKFTMIEIFYFQIIYEILLIIHFGNSLLKKDKWN